MMFDRDSLLGFIDNVVPKGYQANEQAEVSFNGTVIDGKAVVTDPVAVADLHIPGSVIFFNDVDADKGNITGTAEFREIASFGKLAISGKTLFKQELMCESFIINEDGTARVQGKLSSDAAIISGVVEAVHKVSILNLNIGGSLYCNDKVHSDKILVKGSLCADKEVRCIDIRITSDKKCIIESIRAEKLAVVSRAEEGNEYVLECDEADVGSARIAHAKIDRLICDSCHIGEGCKIGILECSGSYVIDEGAEVSSINSHMYI